MRIRFFILSVFLLMTACMACADSKKVVFVSILPQKFFVEKISGGLVEAEVMVPPGASPATYEPKPSQMRKLAASKAYFSIGVPFEKVWLGRIAGVSPEMTIIRTDAGIRKREMLAHHHQEEHHKSHGKGHEVHEKKHDIHKDVHHHQAGLDPHIWLSPKLLKKQLVNTTEGLKKLFPEYSERFAGNLHSFLKEVDKLDRELQTIFKDRYGMKFMVFHPSWGYFADNYGLEQVAIEVEGKDPKPAQLQKLITHARENKIKVIFVQPQFSTKSARIIAREIGGEMIFIDQLAENWLENMADVARKMAAVTR